MTRRLMTAMVLVLTVSGCGSDGKGGSATVPVTNTATPSPTPAASPTPSPTPAPSPTPTPTASRTYTYERASNFKSDRTFTGYDRINVTVANGKAFAGSISSSETGVTSYATKNGTITLADSSDLPNGGVYSVASGGANISAGQRVQTSTNGGNVSIGLVDSLVKYEYFTEAVFSSSSLERIPLIGAPTNPAELPTSGTLTYLALIQEENNAAGKVAAQPLTIDRATGKVTGTISAVNSNGSASLDFELTGTIDANAHVTGTVRSKDGTVTGQFSGRPFGQGGKEIALLLNLTQQGEAYGYLLSGRLK